MGLIEVLESLLGLSPAPDPKPKRPQGPGLNIGEANVRKAVGLPTTARKTQYATSSGPGSGSAAVRQRERNHPTNEGINRAVAAQGRQLGGVAKNLTRTQPKRDHGHDFDFGRLDSLSNWKGELPEIGSALGHGYTEVNDWTKTHANPNDAGKGLLGIWNYANRPYQDHQQPIIGYDKNEGFNADWDQIGDAMNRALILQPPGEGLAAKSAAKQAKKIFPLYGHPLEDIGAAGHYGFTS